MIFRCPEESKLWHNFVHCLRCKLAKCWRLLFKSHKNNPWRLQQSWPFAFLLTNKKQSLPLPPFHFSLFSMAIWQNRASLDVYLAIVSAFCTPYTRALAAQRRGLAVLGWSWAPTLFSYWSRSLAFGCSARHTLGPAGHARRVRISRKQQGEKNVLPLQSCTIKSIKTANAGPKVSPPSALKPHKKPRPPQIVLGCVVHTITRATAEKEILNTRTLSLFHLLLITIVVLLFIFLFHPVFLSSYWILEL